MTSARENAAIHAKAIVEDRKTYTDQMRHTRLGITALYKGCTIDQAVAINIDGPAKRIGLVRFDHPPGLLDRWIAIDSELQILGIGSTKTALLADLIGSLGDEWAVYDYSDEDIRDACDNAHVPQEDNELTDL